MNPVSNPAVAAAFDAYPAAVRPKLLVLRSLIIDVAANTEGVGQLEETLKWGEPAYLTSQSKSGSTIRLGWKPSAPDMYAMYFNCQTTLVASFRQWFPNDLEFSTNRAILFRVAAPVATQPVKRCIAAALTYHRHKTQMRG